MSFRIKSKAEKIYARHVKSINECLKRSCYYNSDLDFTNDIIAATYVISANALIKAHDKEWVKLFLDVITVTYIKKENVLGFIKAVKFYESVSKGRDLRADCILGAEDTINNLSSRFTIAMGDRYTNPMLIMDYDNAPTLIDDYFKVSLFCKNTLSKISDELAKLYNELLVCKY